MTLLDPAMLVLNGLKADPEPLNCYSYGWILAPGDGSVKLQGSLGQCPPPGLRPPIAVGWIDPAGSPLVGQIGENPRCWIAYTDCSGFIAWALHQTSPGILPAVRAQRARIPPASELGRYLAAIDLQHGQPWPSAADYAALGMKNVDGPLQALGGNEQLDPGALLPGDILAWGLRLHAMDTGHVVIVAATPTCSDGAWAVDAIDASILKHAEDDRPGGKGVGRGTIHLQQLPAGEWTINFDTDIATQGKNKGQMTDSYEPTVYTSALRLSM